MKAIPLCSPYELFDEEVENCVDILVLGTNEGSLISFQKDIFRKALQSYCTQDVGRQ
jgi:hypothetical protein